MKKVCLVIPSLEKGGMERVMVTLANNWSLNEVKVCIICLIPHTKIEYELCNEVDVIYPNLNYKDSLLYKIRVLYFLVSELYKSKCDVVLGFGERFNPFVIFASKLSRKKVYISDRSNPFKKHGLFGNMFRNLLYPFASGIIAQTSVAKKLMIEKRMNKNVITISNPLREINDFYEKEYNNIIVSVGRLIKSKNFIELIDIFKACDNKEWELWILGDGPERENIEKYIFSQGFQSKVKLLGKVDDVDYYLSKASIFAFTSLSEGFPNALMEAMSFPLASISYDCNCGPNDLISHEGNGLLIKEGNKNEYIYYLNKLIKDLEFRKKIMCNSVDVRKKQSQDVISDLFLKFIYGKGN